MSPMNVGARLRQLRLERGLSVRGLAAATGFSPSLISQVEHGHVMPSIGSLERIALALGVSLSTVFAATDTHPAGLVRANARPQLTSTWSPVVIEALRPMKGVARLEPVLVVMAPGGRSGTFPPVPAGEKFVFVLEGTVTLTLGDDGQPLGPGDAITFAATLPHQLENTGAAPARLLIVTMRGPR